MLKDIDILNWLKFLTEECFLKTNNNEVFSSVLGELWGFINLGEDLAPQYYNDLAEELISIID